MSEFRIDQSDPNFGWGPAIPLPLYGGWLWWQWFGCSCGERFKAEDDYREHYARNHWPDAALGGTE